jgi:hypothetical protein
MTTVSWTQTQTAGGTYAWATAGDWSSGYAPLRDDDVQITTAVPVTVTYGTTTGTNPSVILDSLTTGGGDTLDLLGGTITTVNGYTLAGALDISGGALVLGGSGTFGDAITGSVTMTGGALVFSNAGTIAPGLDSGTFDQSAGVITINHSVLTDADSGTLTGTVTGAGELLFVGGSTVLTHGFVLATHSVEIGAATVFLEENLTYGNVFTLGANSVLNLSSTTGTAVTLSLSGTSLAALDGDIRGGIVSLNGQGHLNGLALDNGAEATVNTTYTETGTIVLGNVGTGTLTIAAGGDLRIIGNFGIIEGPGGGVLVNDGTIEKSFGSSLNGTAVISAELTNTGLLDAASGVIELAGPSGGQASVIGGTLAGAGTFQFDNGFYILAGETLTANRLLFTQNVNVTIESASSPSATLTYVNNWDQNDGLILVEQTLDLNGRTSLDGGEMKGTATINFGAPGADTGFLHLGNTMDLEGNLTFILNENVNQTGSITLGELSDSVDQATITTGTTWALEGASNISGSYGTITNYGVFEKSSGALVATVSSNVTNTTSGTLITETGTLSLTGTGSLNGSVTGAGALDISGQFYFGAGLSLTVGELILDLPIATNDVQASLLGNLTYGGDFALESGTLALNGGNTLGGNTLTLTGITSLASGAILGGGEVVVKSASTIGGAGTLALAQGANLELLANSQQISNIIMTSGAAAPDLTIAAGATLTMNDETEIGGVQDSVVGTVTVDGTLASRGADIIAAALVNNGTINISTGALTFLGPLSGSGVFEIGNGSVLQFENGNVNGGKVVFSAAGGGGQFFDGTPADFKGTIAGFAAGDQIEFGGFAFVGASLSLSTNGEVATIKELNGTSASVSFTTAQKLTSLTLGVGESGFVALIHS